MSEPDEFEADVLDAFAILTAGYGDDAKAISRHVRVKILGTLGDFDIGYKLFGLISGMTVVARTLLDYGLDMTGDKDDDALTEVVAHANNTSVLRVLGELTEVTKQFVDHCAQQTGASHDDVLARLGRDLNESFDE